MVRRLQSLVIAALLILVACGGVWVAQSLRGAPHPATTTCQEDDPCWDCHTMGNRRCGP